MKKYLVSICAAFAMFVMVSCTGNPGISAMKEFIANPTEETFKAVDAAEAEMTEEQKAEKISTVKGLYETLGVGEDAKQEIIRLHSQAITYIEELGLAEEAAALLKNYANKLIGRNK